MGQDLRLSTEDTALRTVQVASAPTHTELGASESQRHAIVPTRLLLTEYYLDVP